MKRGQSGISCLVGVDKPRGMSSHDVVNACRRIFGERRVGHTGTLDPLATGALCIAFGVATDTDDAEGEPIRTAPVPECVCDRAFAQEHVAGLVGKHKQLPPAYSAIKRGGVKAYEVARAGNVVQLEPRDIEIYEAILLGLETDHDAPCIYWDVRLSVSKGTYIRSIARDIGTSLGSAAHVEALRRLRSGALDVQDCLSLDALEKRGLDEQAADVRNGKTLRARDIVLFEAPRRFDDSDCGPLRGAHRCADPLAEGEVVSLVHENELVALYTAQAKRGVIKPCCVFSQGVTRGKGF